LTSRVHVGRCGCGSVDCRLSACVCGEALDEHDGQLSMMTAVSSNACISWHEDCFELSQHH
jgi:hypothetical protein